MYFRFSFRLCFFSRRFIEAAFEFGCARLFAEVARVEPCRLLLGYTRSYLMSSFRFGAILVALRSIPAISFFRCFETVGVNHFFVLSVAHAYLSACSRSMISRQNLDQKKCLFAFPVVENFF